MLRKIIFFIGIVFCFTFLTCHNINEPDLGILEIQLDWSAFQQQQSLNKTDSLTNIAYVLLELEPGSIQQYFDGFSDNYQIDLQLGIYNILLKACSADSSLLFSADTSEILVSPNNTTQLGLIPKPNFPTKAPEFVGLSASQTINSDDYKLLWTSVKNATQYILEESEAETFATSTELYSGPDTLISISNKPQGDYYYRVKATNQTASSVWSNSVHFKVELSDSLSLNPLILPNGQIYRSYSTILEIFGGIAPYSVETEGTLPNGTSIALPNDDSNEIQITGIPTESGTWPLLVKITDSSVPVKTLEHQFELIIESDSLKINTTTLPVGQINESYTGMITCSGGSGDMSSVISKGELPTGLTFTTTNQSIEITGMPTQSGEFSFRLLVWDNLYPTMKDSTDFTLVINSDELQITTTELSDGQIGESYEEMLSAIGGTPSYTWSLADGSLPDGLSLVEDTISGTPTTAGTFTFIIQVMDAQNQSSSKSLSITVQSENLVITTTTLADGQIGEGYEETLLATGGTQPYNWSISEGSLPDGLSLVEDTISGTPTTAGTFDFTIQVMDAQNQLTSKSLSITVQSETLVITTTTLADGQIGEGYEETLLATGGTQPYTWLISDGSLPNGLSLVIDTISGTPTSAGTFEFTVQVTDAQSQITTKQLSITVNAETLQIASTWLPSGEVGQAYNQQIYVNGGTPPYSWTLDSGDLPNGISLSTNGVISGTPTEPETAYFTVRVQDSGGQSDSREFSIKINGNSLTITTSSPLPDGTAGVVYNQTLNASGGTPPYTWEEISRNGGGFAEGLSLSSDGILSGNPGNQPESGQIEIRVTDSNTNSINKTFDLTINAGTLELFNYNLPDAEEGTSGYWGTITYRYGTAPLVTPWTITGSLPPGLSVDGYDAQNYQMNISGTPTLAGTYNFQITVYDASSPQLSRTDDFSITITTPPFSITTTSLNEGKINTSYNEIISTLHGSIPLSYSITSGSLPPGININPFNDFYEVTGTPTSAGLYNFTIEASDNSSPPQTDSQALSIKVNIRITTNATLAVGQVAEGYEEFIYAEGASGSYDWSVISGSLPPGISLSSEGLRATLSGTFTTAGTFVFTVRAQDHTTPSLADSKIFSITVEEF